ncbi:MAG: bifunctional hydroxymethylpyrimidine kinase/phosphomethylpyrimidine kinase [Alphaproteobacteria bacterium]|nr:bifunctional hydroxymethylpyrimidine kinase/phosphomethylpyrimidine kinase [Alphaproteobacteria bacterium]
MTGRVLIVAGSDSSAGAGIQADIKTVMALGGYAATAITALTAQSTFGVAAVLPVGPDFVRRQIEAVLADIGADAVKTGMLVDAAVVETVADALAALAPTVPLVIDPVIAATSGTALLDEPGVERLKRRLIARAAVVTPNVPEAAMLTGLTVADLDGMRRAADALLRLGAGAVVVKGGHLQGETLADLVVTPRDSFVLEARRQKTRATHGTGCTYASAIAAGLAQGLALRRAIERAHDFVQQAIRHAPGLGKGRGPLGYAPLPAGRKTRGKHVRRHSLRRRAKSRRR